MEEYTGFSRQQLDHPFRISNRAFDLKDPTTKDDPKLDRFLTFINQKHPIEQKFLAEFEERKESPDQIWRLEEVEKGSKYRIKHEKSGLYLTPTNGKTPNFYKKKNWHQFLVQLVPLIQGQGQESQAWSFELSQHRRFKVKTQVGKDATYNYLESAQPQRLIDGYRSVVLLRPEAYPERTHLQNWKFSPVIPVPPLPVFNLEQFLNNSCLDEEKLLIKFFKGKIFKKDSPLYKSKVYQYATSSYPADKMSPYMIAFPTDIQDIRVMINMVKPTPQSKRPCKRIVVRSGGHQYSGLSSGGNDTIVLGMDLFNTIAMKDGLVEVEPCVPLRTASKFFRDNKISVPHGVCPLVNIGGHGQTGGYGHFTRTFGLLIDYIQAFDIVLADGTFKKVNRPTAQNPTDLELFRGVMGGNAGSFGIVTKFYLKPIRDQDHPHAYSISKIRFFNETTFKAVMKEYQRWTQLIAANNDESIRGLDILFSLTQFQVEIVGLKRTVMSLVGFYSDPDGNKPYKGQFQKLFKTFTEGQSFAEWTLNKFADISNGQQPLSIIAESYVLKFPSVTHSGREYNLPYKKRGNVTVCPLTDQYIDQLTEQTSIVVSPSEKELNLVIQMIAGGGQYKRKGEEKVNGLSVTSIPLRNLTHTFSFDIFYQQGPDSQKRSEERQKVMQQTVQKYYSGEVGEKIFFWTSFGGPENLDMRRPQVVKKFYDSQESYQILQKLKKEVDPSDIFSSIMTVKLPGQ